MSATDAGLRTGEVADRAGVNIQALRYYERRGLLREPASSIGGHRHYPPDTVPIPFLTIASHTGGDVS